MLTLGLCERHIAGDDALLALAQMRLGAAGLGAEMHAGSPEELEAVMAFRPRAASPNGPELPVVVHLARHFRLPDAQAAILAIASRFAGRVYGLVLHDHPDLAARPAEYLAAVRDLDRGLGQIRHRPWVFLEYAAGLDLAVYRAFLTSIRDLENINAGVDVGHVGIWRTRQAFAQLHPGQDVCALKERPMQLPDLMADIDLAVAEALPTVLNLIGSLGALGKPVHFHLHDGHPLSTFSPYGVSDHLSFLAEIPLPFADRGRRRVPLMYGPDGLTRIVRQALATLGSGRVSCTLEIHPPPGRLPLDASAAKLFRHWTDLTNAERMNHWLATLTANHQILRHAASAAESAGR